MSRINFYLSDHQISIISLKKRNLKFHARHSAKKRQYEYVILNRVSKASIEKDKVWLIKKKLDYTKMKIAIKFFLGTHNFSAFRSSSCTAKSPIKTISFANIKKNNNKYIIKFESK